MGSHQSPVLHHRRLCLSYNLRELSIFNHFRDDIKTAQQFALEKDHGECRPVNMGLESLANVIILQDIERVISDSLVCQESNQFPR